MGSIRLPPGFRFHPTDQELVEYYLREKAEKRLGKDCVIVDVDLLAHEPWDLPSLSSLTEGEWYFFCPRDRKYPNGSRANRATEKGYWKATGKDKQIFSLRGPKELIGMKKTLVFYQGRAPSGARTDWVMHEYRLEARGSGKLRQGDYVLCRVFCKSAAALDGPSGFPIGGQSLVPMEKERFETLPSQESLLPADSATVQGDSSPLVPPQQMRGAWGSVLPVEPKVELDDEQTNTHHELVSPFAIRGGEAPQQGGGDCFSGLGEFSEEEQQLLDEFFLDDFASGSVDEMSFPVAEAAAAAISHPMRSLRTSEGLGHIDMRQATEQVAVIPGPNDSLELEDLHELYDAPECDPLGWLQDPVPSEDVVEPAPNGPVSAADEGTSVYDYAGTAEPSINPGYDESFLECVMGDDDDGLPQFEEVTQLADELAAELDASAAQEAELHQPGLVGEASNVSAGTQSFADITLSESGADSQRRGAVGTQQPAQLLPRRSLEEDLRHVLRAHGVVVDQSDLVFRPSAPGAIRPRARPVLSRRPSQQSTSASTGSAVGAAAGLNRVRLQLVNSSGPRFNAANFSPEFQEALALDSEMAVEEEDVHPLQGRHTLLGRALANRPSPRGQERRSGAQQNVSLADDRDVGTGTSAATTSGGGDPAPAVRRIVVGGRQPVAVQQLGRNGAVPQPLPRQRAAPPYRPEGVLEVAGASGSDLPDASTDASMPLAQPPTSEALGVHSPGGTREQLARRVPPGWLQSTAHHAVAPPRSAPVIPGASASVRGGASAPMRTQAAENLQSRMTAPLAHPQPVSPVMMPTSSVQFNGVSAGHEEGKGADIQQRNLGSGRPDRSGCARTQPLVSAIRNSRRRHDDHVVGGRVDGTSLKHGGQESGSFEEGDDSRAAVSRVEAVKRRQPVRQVPQGLIWVLERLPVLPASAAELPGRGRASARPQASDVSFGERNTLLKQQGLENGEGWDLSSNSVQQACLKRPLYGAAARSIQSRSIFSSFLAPMAAWGPVDWMIVGAVATCALHAAGHALGLL